MSREVETGDVETEEREHASAQGGKKERQRIMNAAVAHKTFWRMFEKLISTLRFDFFKRKTAQMKPRRFHVGILTKPKQTFNADRLKITTFTNLRIKR